MGKKRRRGEDAGDKEEVVWEDEKQCRVARKEEVVVDSVVLSPKARKNDGAGVWCPKRFPNFARKIFTKLLTSFSSSLLLLFQFPEFSLFWFTFFSCRKLPSPFQKS